MSASLCDRTTEIVLGLDALRARLAPHSEAGSRRVDKMRPYGIDDEEDWRAEMKRLAATEAWRDAAPERAETAVDALGQLPLLDRPLRTLRADAVLDDGQLFCLKRFLFYGKVAIEAADDLLAKWGLADDATARFERLIDLIHPGGHASPRFHLADELGDDIAETRGRLREKKRDLREVRGHLEDEIKAEFGGTFDINGRYHPGDEGRAQMALERDDRLERLAGGWQLRDDELDELRGAVDKLVEEVERAEQRVRSTLSEKLATRIEWFERTEQHLAALDVRLAKVRLRAEIGGCWPEWRDDPGCAIEGGREPGLIEQLSERDDESLQPVEVDLDARPAVVTGPNMGGKSVLLRLIGVCQWAAQHALPAPAARFEFAPLASIVYVGSEEPDVREANEGLSSFGREIARLVDRQQHSARPALWLLDEVGRGTHPEEGSQIARDLVASLADRDDRVVCATHFPALTELDGALKLRIAGLTDPDRLEALLARDDLDVEDALRRSMDYRPVVADRADVPRDARVVARALGLDV
ncbi:MAG: MutS-related protein [Persicimonas sp.]